MSDEMDELSDVLTEHLAVKDEKGHVVLQVALIATVYFPDAYRRDVREAIVTCCEEYFRRWGEHLRWALHPDTRRMERFGQGKGSNPRGWLPAMGEDKSFSLMYHGAEYERGAGAFSVRGMGMERYPYLDLGFLRISLPLLSLADRSSWLPAVLLDICRMLKPFSGYGGIGVVESPDRSISDDYEPIVYHWAQRLPGLEADYPTSHSTWLAEGREGGRDGIKGVNWLTVLSDRYVTELGGTEKIEADLAALDSRFVVHRYDGGVLIQAGPRPQLGDVERDLWPALYVTLAKYLKPIRITEHRPFQREGAGERFDKKRSEAWLRRFDDR